MIEGWNLFWSTLLGMSAFSWATVGFILAIGVFNIMGALTGKVAKGLFRWLGN